MNNKFAALNNFDILRLLFALLVFLFHSSNYIGFKMANVLFHLQGQAVHGFFIISGFLILWSFDKNNDIIKYSIKRFFRIYPLYFLIIIFQALILVFLSSNFNFFDVIKYLTGNLVFQNYIAPSIGNLLVHSPDHAINCSLWTLKIEVMFYILLPFIYYLFKKFGPSLLIILYFISACYSFFIHSRFLLILFPSHLKFFIVGMLLYLYGSKLIEILAKTKMLTVFLLLTFTILSIYVSSGFFKAFIYPVTIGMVVFLAAFCIPHRKVPLDISYGLYVIHFPVLQLLLMYNIFTDDYKSFLFFASLIILGLSILSAKFIEKPFIKFGHKLCKKVNEEDFINNLKHKETGLIGNTIGRLLIFYKKVLINFSLEHNN